jgi:hypothetical protein
MASAELEQTLGTPYRSGQPLAGRFGAEDDFVIERAAEILRSP